MFEVRERGPLCDIVADGSTRRTIVVVRSEPRGWVMFREEVEALLVEALLSSLF